MPLWARGGKGRCSRGDCQGGLRGGGDTQAVMGEGGSLAGRWEQRGPQGVLMEVQAWSVSLRMGVGWGMRD